MSDMHARIYAIDTNERSLRVLVLTTTHDPSQIMEAIDKLLGSMEKVQHMTVERSVHEGPLAVIVG